MNIKNSNIKTVVREIRAIEDKNSERYYYLCRALLILGIDIESMNKSYHCSVCGSYYGKSFIHSGCDPECATCGWMGRY